VPGFPEIRVVQRIERFQADFGSSVLVDGKLLRQAQVECCAPGTQRHIPAGVAGRIQRLDLEAVVFRKSKRSTSGLNPVCGSPAAGRLEEERTTRPKASYPSWASVTPMESMAFDRHNTGPDHAGVERLSTRSPRARERAVEYRHSRRTNRFAQWDAGASRPSKPAPGRHEAIEAQIRYEIAVMQGVMICDLHQDEHLVRLDAPEVRPGH
jgi:hypothetical protein